ncbi:MAG: TolC family protein, partial [Prevotella sp.]|nr:TolC family protein [Prevotella sp.]
MMRYNNHNFYMKLTSACFLLLFMVLPTFSQEVLSLDSCRAMALRNNKQVNIARLKQDVAKYTHKAAKTKYLPHVDIMGGYEFTSRPISLLNNGQKETFSNLGTTAAG